MVRANAADAARNGFDLMERQSVTIYNAQQGIQALRGLWQALKPWAFAGHRLIVEVREETRSDAQNNLMFSRLADISSQVEWHGMKLSRYDWKDMATASLKKQRAVPNLDGTGFVVLGQRTSKMTRAEMTELIDFLGALGDQHGVKWAPTSLGADDEQ